MAKIKAGILSKVSGKVAGVVGGTWKGTNYLRELVKPSNPNTPLQQAQRGKMAFVVASARQIVGDILNPYLNKFCKTMSGYNWFCRENIGKLGGDPLKFTSAPQLSFGTLGSGSISTDALDQNLEFNFPTIPNVPAGHALKAIACIVGEDGKFYSIKTINNPTAGTGVEIDTTGMPVGTNFYYGLAFFADFDANGVLQAISTSVATAKTSIQITE